MISEFKIQAAQWEGAKFWDVYGISNPSELVLEDIAFARGVLVKEGPLQKMDARLIRKGDLGLIRVREDIPENGRKRFAIAHELGHWELHKNISQLFTCTEKDFMAKYKGSSEEIEANYFAVSLLMPEDHFKHHSKDMQMSLATVSQLAEYYMTSLTATARRYTELSNDYCAVICSQKGKIKWWQGSVNFESCFKLQVGSNVSRDSVAGGLFDNPAQDDRIPERVDISAWSEKNGCAGQSEFIEESIYMSKYNQVFTLLYLP